MAFVHLHNHTVFSMLDGATRIQDMVNRAVELGMPAVAITDHGYMYGVPDLALACDAVNHNTPEYKTWSHDKAFLEKDRRDELVEPDAEANPRIPHVEVQIKVGRIRETLKEKMIDVIEPDIIVCGARGLSSIKYALLGSISTYLLRNCTCDILVVKRPAIAGASKPL